MLSFHKSDYTLIYEHLSGAKLFVGNWDSSFDEEFLKGIGAVVNCTSAKNRNFDDDQENYLRVRLPEEGLNKYKMAFAFIEKYLINKHNVLVHCAAGVSRSISIIIGYLMLKEKWSFDKTYRHVTSLRKHVPNPLMYQGELLELQLENK